MSVMDLPRFGVHHDRLAPKAEVPPFTMLFARSLVLLYPRI
jgi:hypothetical protein